MSDLEILLFCAVIGFVIAGCLASFYKLVTSRSLASAAQDSKALGMAVAAVFAVFAGPVLIFEKVVEGMRGGKLPPLAAVGGLVISLVWSACAGVLLVGLAIAI